MEAQNRRSAAGSELAASGATLIDEHHVMWQGRAAREVRSRLKDTVAIQRYVIVGHRMYTGKVLFGVSAPEPVDDGTRFYSSWRLLH